MRNPDLSHRQKTTAIASCLLSSFILLCGQPLPAAPGGFLELRDGYFWDADTGRHFFPRGVAYQSWNPPVFANQSEAQVAYDMRQFVKMRANSVRAEFVWGETEIADDVYDWTRSDFLVQTAEDLGLKLFVLIGFQYPPSWFPEEHRAINDRGTRSEVLNYQSAEAQTIYKEHMATIVSRYKDSPAIGGWIIGNEFAFFDLWEDLDLYPARRLLGFDPISVADFHDYLQESYGDDISELNATWGSTFANFDEIPMPLVYPENRNDEPGYHDVIQWRKKSIAQILALGAKAVKDNDPNHLVSYSMVGGILTGRDANNTCEDPETIVQACEEIGAPLDFWSVNNYAWATEGAELRSLDFGIAKYQDRIGLPVLISETGHTSSETVNDEATFRQAEALLSSLWEPVTSGAVGVHFFHWNDRDAFNGTPFERETGFGIVHQNRISKGAVFDNVEGLFLRMGEIDIANLLRGSRSPAPDILFYLSPEADVGFPRANQEQTMLSGGLRRLGYQIGLIGHEDLMNNQFGSAQALTFPRCEQMEPEVLGHVLSDVLPAGIHVHADTDLAGKYNAYRQTNPNWAAEFQAIFGLDVTGAHAPWDGGVSQVVGSTYEFTNLSGTTGFGSLPTDYSERILSWKIWHDVHPVAGSTILKHDGLRGSAPGSCALQFLDHAGAKAAANTFALGDTHSLVNGTHGWDMRFAILGAIYRDYFGIVPKIQLTGPKALYVMSDYRICRNGSVLISLLNPHVGSVSGTLTSDLLNGKTVESLNSGGIVETDSDGSVEFSLAGDSLSLFYVYDESGGADGSLIDRTPYRLWFDSAPQVIWPSPADVSASVGYDTRGEALDLVVSFESADRARRSYGNSSPLEVTGSGAASRSFNVLDADLMSAAYLSSPDGGSYQIRASLVKDGATVAEVEVPVRLTWGVRPLSLPETVAPGGSYQVEIEWEELPSFLPGEMPNSIDRADLFDSAAALDQHYNIVLELRDSAQVVVASDVVVTRSESGSHEFSIDVPGGASGPFHWFAYAQTAADASGDFVDSFEGNGSGAGVVFNPMSTDLGPTVGSQAAYTGELISPVAPMSAVVTATIDGIERELEDDGSGNLSGDGGDSGTLDYETGAVTLSFGTAPTTGGAEIVVSYHVGVPEPDVIEPWTNYTYAHQGPADRLYLNHGIHIEGFHGSQSIFLVLSNPPDVGEFSGFGIFRSLPSIISLPSDPAGLSEWTFSFAFREDSQLPCTLELQIKDSQVPPGVVIFSRAYDPLATPGSWDTISASLDQFQIPPWSLQPTFIFSEVSEIACNVAMLQLDEFYLGSIDDVRLDGPEQIVTGGEIVAIYDSRNDSLLDSDGDGLADVYENGTGTFVSATEIGTDPGNPDTDGDGQSDGAEVVAGTDPNSDADHFRIHSTGMDPANGDLIIIFDGRAGRTYELEFFEHAGVLDGALIFLPRLGFAPVEVGVDGPVEVRIPIGPEERSTLVRVRARMSGG